MKSSINKDIRKQDVFTDFKHSASKPIGENEEYNPIEINKRIVSNIK